MFVIYDKEKQSKPIKIWLEKPADIEEGCLKQAVNLSNLPFVHKHVALMPDTHQGYGMPIGGVLATKGVIIPNAVGHDIGCGMCFLKTNITKDQIMQNTIHNKSLLQLIIDTILENIPVGFQKHKSPQNCATYNYLVNENPIEQLEYMDCLFEEFDNMLYQIGTLGGGNHFIEIQEDDLKNVCIMIHSGSRNFGYKIAQAFNKKAIELNEMWHSKVERETKMAFLPVNHESGQSYLYWMNLALRYAEENRFKMMEKVKSIICNLYKKHACDTHTIEFGRYFDVHHNYAALENHFGENVYVHRKGAIRSRCGELGIIPGSMGSNSYIAVGSGNEESFQSCSHGAGRKLGRKVAMRSIKNEDALHDLEKNNVVIGKNNMQDLAEECRLAYKDINSVMSNQEDLVSKFITLKTLGVVKG